jgi:hypothetical protein
MNTSLVACSKCKTLLLDDVFNIGKFGRCPNCNASLQIQVFPALFRQFAPGRQAETVVEESESSCFYHPGKRASLPCDACGRFLCALCDCELNEQHFCPGCLESGRKKGKIKKLENQRTLYDNMALTLAIYPLLIFWLTIVTAPISIYLVIRHWNTPTSIVHRSKVRFIFALIIASLQIAGWIIAIYMIVTRN